MQSYPGTERTHLPGGEITASEQHRRHQDWLDQQPTTVVCAFCAGWSFTGPAVEARAAASLHRDEQHPELDKSKRRTVKRECKVPGCSTYCKPGSDRCWDHAATVKETAGATSTPTEAAVSSTAAGGGGGRTIGAGRCRRLLEHRRKDEHGMQGRGLHR